MASNGSLALRRGLPIESEEMIFEDLLHLDEIIIFDKHSELVPQLTDVERTSASLEYYRGRDFNFCKQIKVLDKIITVATQSNDIVRLKSAFLRANEIASHYTQNLHEPSFHLHKILESFPMGYRHIRSLAIKDFHRPEYRNPFTAPYDEFDENTIEQLPNTYTTQDVDLIMHCPNLVSLLLLGKNDRFMTADTRRRKMVRVQDVLSVFELLVRRPQLVQLDFQWTSKRSGPLS